MNLKTPSALGLAPAWATVRGTDNQFDVADSVDISARWTIEGQGNRVGLGAGVTVERYAPAGFGATVPDLGKRSDAAVLIEGDGNLVQIAAGVRLAMNVVIRGNRNRITIGPDAYLHGFANLITDDAALSVGAKTTMVQGSLQLHEPFNLEIGRDCMISSQVYVSVSDIHGIQDQATGTRINPGASVWIGDHVWLGLRTMVMKGARIGPGAVTAAGAIISGEVAASTIVAGSPARVVREGIVWTRELDGSGL